MAEVAFQQQLEQKATDLSVDLAGDLVRAPAALKARTAARPSEMS
jgi:hypothetical protein